MFLLTIVISYSANSYHKCSQTQKLSIVDPVLQRQTRKFTFSGQYKQLNGLHFITLSEWCDFNRRCNDF